MGSQAVIDVTDTKDGADLPVWDRETFDGFTDWMPRHRVQTLLESFREQAREAIASLPDSASDEAWEKASHDMLYSAGTLGFVRLAEACQLMQGAIRKKQVPPREQRTELVAAMTGALNASEITIEGPAP